MRSTPIIARTLSGLLGILLATLPAALLGRPLSAQTTHIVDASGKVGKFTSVVAAVKAAASGDKILIYPGVYPGTIELVSKALSLIGVTGKAYDVVIRSTFANGLALVVRWHPAGAASRISSLTLDQTSGISGVVVIGLGAGDLYFENIWSGRPWDVLSWNGTVSMANCLAKVVALPQVSPLYAFKFKNVKQVFLRDCIFEANSRRRSGREPTASCSSPAPRRSTSARSRDRSPRSEVRACLVKAATGFVSSAPRPASAAMGRTSSSVVRVRSSLPRGAGTA